MGKKSGSGSGMNNPDHISDSLPITIFWVKILKFFVVDPGSGMEKIRIRDGNKFVSGIGDKNPGSATHWCFQGDATHICGAGCQLFSGDPATASQPCHRQMGARRGGPSSQSYKTLQGNSDSAVDPDPYPDPDWIRMHGVPGSISGSGFAIRIPEGKNDPHKHRKSL